MTRHRPAYLVTLALTLLIGLALRFDLADGVLAQVGLAMSDVRHAHSHLGFYGALTLAWWLVLDRRGAPTFTPTVTRAYLALVALASALFTFMGYAWPTILLSTLIAGFWLVAAWRLWRHAPSRATWLALAPWGVVLGIALVPAIAVTARRDLALSRDLAHVFIGVMLLVTFVPVALASLTTDRAHRHAWLWGVTAALGTAHVVFADRSPWPLGLLLVVAGAALAPALVGLAAPRWLTLLWWGIPPGLAALGLAPVLQQEGVRVAALHYVVLGPLVMTTLHTLVPERLAARPWALAWTLVALATKLAAMSLAPLLGWPLGLDLAAWAAVALVVGMGALVLPVPAARAHRQAT